MTVEACRVSDGHRQADTCRVLIRERDMVRQTFGRSLCPNATWDMILALYLSRYDSKKMMLTALCAAAHVPEATAYRKIDELERRGLILRHDDPLDRRRVYIALSTEGVVLIEELLSRIDRSPLTEG